MKLQDLTGLNKDDVLAYLGLESRTSTASHVLSALGTFGLGVVLGAGAALLLAPKAGSELREDIRSKVMGDGDNAAEGRVADNPARDRFVRQPFSTSGSTASSDIGRQRPSSRLPIEGTPPRV